MAMIEIYTRRHPLRQSSRRLLQPAKMMAPEPMDIENPCQPITKESRCDSRRAFGTNVANCMSRGSLARPVKKSKEVSPPCSQRDKKVSRRLLDSLQMSPEKLPRKQFPSEALVYESSILQYIQDCEDCSIGLRDFMQYQTEIDSNMRSILINWIVDVHEKFKLRSETLFMTISLIDRFLNEETITRSKLQLLGITSLLIASKYEEIYVPDIKRFVDVCDNAYRTADLLDMEGRVLLKLNFNLTYNSSLSQMQHKIRALDLSDQVSTYCSFILQLCLLEYRMCQYKPTLMALASIYLSNKLLNTGKINSAELMSRFNLQERLFKSCLKDMFETYKRKGNTELQAVKRKFARLGVL